MAPSGRQDLLSDTPTSSCTILIAAATNLPWMRSHVVADGSEVLAFSDTETLRALEAIVTRRPSRVALDASYVATARGRALVNRIKVDSTLAATELRVVDVAAGSTSTVEAPQAPLPAFDAAGTTIDYRGTRRVPRIGIAEHPEIMVDGHQATLIDLSPLGAQVISPTVLRPNQLVRVVLPHEHGTIRVAGTVIWASFEMAPDGARYRAGLDFAGEQAKALELFCLNYSL